MEIILTSNYDWAMSQPENLGLYGLGGLPRFAKICRILQPLGQSKLRFLGRNASLPFLTSVYGTEGLGFESLQARFFAGVMCSVGIWSAKARPLFGGKQTVLPDELAR